MGARARKLLAGTAVAASTLVATAAARADDDTQPNFGAGVFVGYRFAADAGVEWGFEGFATYRNDLPFCTSARRYGAGPLAQLAIRDWFEQPRITLAMQAGGELQRAALALSGELGVSYVVGPRGGFGLHTGVLPEITWFNAGLRYEWLLNQGSLSGGLRVQPTYGEPYMCAVGRPLRSEAGVLSWRHACGEHDELGSAVGQAFERDAQHELSSVPAFLQLASELWAAGAPADLVRRALAAARDEQLHAGLCARLAGRFLRRPVALALPEVARRPQRKREQARLRLLRESWSDGCLAEGAAAAHAAAAAQRARDPETRAALARIARDELRHTELAWAILRWALGHGGERARAELAGARDAAPAVIDEQHAPEGFARLGRLGAAQLSAIAREHADRSRARLARLLG